VTLIDANLGEQDQFSFCHPTNNTAYQKHMSAKYLKFKVATSSMQKCYESLISECGNPIWATRLSRSRVTQHLTYSTQLPLKRRTKFPSPIINQCIITASPTLFIDDTGTVSSNVKAEAVPLINHRQIRFQTWFIDRG
jgi:hypothetical protein